MILRGFAIGIVEQENKLKLRAGANAYFSATPAIYLPDLRPQLGHSVVDLVRHPEYWPPRRRSSAFAGPCCIKGGEVARRTIPYGEVAALIGELAALTSQVVDTRRC